MEITEVRIGPSDDERIAAYASITIDDCFVIHGLRVKVSKKVAISRIEAIEFGESDAGLIRREWRCFKRNVSLKIADCVISCLFLCREV